MRELQARFLELCNELDWKNEANVGETEQLDEENEFEKEDHSKGGSKRTLSADFFLPPEHDLSEARLVRFKNQVSEGDLELVRLNIHFQMIAQMVIT